MANEGLDIAAPDSISIRRWVTIFIGYLLVMSIPAAWLLGQLGQPWTELF